jgi:hypothetical protein
LKPGKSPSWLFVERLIFDALMKGFSSLFPIKFKKDGDASPPQQVSLPGKSEQSVLTGGESAAAQRSVQPTEAAPATPCQREEAVLILDSALFDAVWYSSQLSQGTVRTLGLDDLLAHFVTEGGAAGLNPHKWFDSAYYLKNNRDVQCAGINPLVHFLRSGWREGRLAHPAFDSAWYRRQYRESLSQASCACSELEHFVKFGQEQGCFPNKEDFRAALETEPGLKERREFLELQPLRIFEAPGDAERINLVLSSVPDTTYAEFSSTEEAFLVALLARHAGASNSPLRIVARRRRIDELQWLTLLGALAVQSPERVEFCFCDFIDRMSELPVSPGETFFAHGYNNVRSLCASVNPARVVCVDFVAGNCSLVTERKSMRKITISGALDPTRVPGILSALRSVSKSVPV